MGVIFDIWGERSKRGTLHVHRRPIGRKCTGQADSAVTGRPLPLPPRTLSVEAGIPPWCLCSPPAAAAPPPPAPPPAPGPEADSWRVEGDSQSPWGPQGDESNSCFSGSCFLMGNGMSLLLFWNREGHKRGCRFCLPLFSLDCSKTYRS